jgi:cobalamin synthase
LHYVRTDADAKSRPFDGALSTVDWILSGAWGALTVLVLLTLLSLTSLPSSRVLESAAGGDHPADLLWARTLLTGAGAAAAATLLAGAYFKRRIGGYTGDCLGAVQQLAELGFLLAALALMRVSM